MMHHQNAGKFNLFLETYRVSLACILIFFCLNFFRVIADYMTAIGFPFIIIYSMAVILHNIIPVGIILIGFREISARMSFLLVFLLAGPGVMVMDTIVFTHGSLDLLLTPAYYTQQIIFALLLSTIAAGTSYYSTNSRLSLIIIGVGILLFAFHIKSAFLVFFGIQ